MSGTAQPRRELSQEEWLGLAADPSPPLLALWADTTAVYALLREGDAPLLFSTEVRDGAYPALSPARPDAAWFERMVCDLWGHVASGGIDRRPLLDHARWAVSTPLAVRPGPARAPEPPEFALGEEFDQLPLGPVRGGIEPAAHLRLGVAGETIARLETRLGYTHKGTLALLRGKSPRAAARFAARLAGEATVAHSIAFARATEVALGAEVPPRPLALRELMAALERIAGHLGVLCAMAEIAAGGRLAARLAWRAEAIRRAASTAFGHRLMMDCVVPGGIAVDMASGADTPIRQAVSELPDLARACASLCRSSPWPGLSWPSLVAPAATDGRDKHGHDDGAGHRISPADRLAAIARDADWVGDLLGGLHEGAIAAPLPAESGEGLGCAAGPSGEVWHWLRLDRGQIASAFLCDPAWRKWPCLEAAIFGARVEDLPLMLASFGLSASGIDL